MDDEYVCSESVGEVWHSPALGDMLCFNGAEWKVARRNGWNYPVEEVKELEINAAVPPSTVVHKTEKPDGQGQ